MNRRHGIFLAVAIGLAAIAGTYAALQTTDLGAQAQTLSEQEIAAADARLDQQEAALRRAANKRPPRLPQLPARVSGGAGGPASASSASVGPSSSGPSTGSWDDDDFDDDFDDDDFGDDFDDDHSGHGGGGDDDD